MSQPSVKAAQSVKQVSLNPRLLGDNAEIALSLAAPATLDIVEIDQKTLPAEIKNMIGLEKNGDGTWNLKVKKTLDWTSKTSYNVKLNMWPAGTYDLKDDKPAALTVGGKAKTKPITVSVKMNIVK